MDRYHFSDPDAQCAPDDHTFDIGERTDGTLRVLPCVVCGHVADDETARAILADTEAHEHDWARYGCGLAYPDRVEVCVECNATRTIKNGAQR